MFRVVAPVAFLAAVTVAVWLVRSGLRHHAVSTTSTIATTVPTTPTLTIPGHPGRRFYRIQSGDTLGSIAIRFHTTVARLRRLNPGVDPNSLQTGERIRVR